MPDGFGLTLRGALQALPALGDRRIIITHWPTGVPILWDEIARRIPDHAAAIIGGWPADTLVVRDVLRYDDAEGGVVEVVVG